MEMKSVVIAGKGYPLAKCDGTFVRRLPLDIRLRFAPYLLDFNGQKMVVLEVKKDTHITPDKAHKLLPGIERLVEMPVVFLFKQLAYYERDRYIQKGVFFLVSGKYAYLPYLIINAKAATSGIRNTLSATAQYILLYHLQMRGLDGLTISELEEILPYKYVTLTRAIKTLESLELCTTSLNEERKKVLCFPLKGRELWQQALPYMVNPIAKTVFADGINGAQLVMSGINALAHYSMLAEVEQTAYAITKEDMKKAQLENANPMDGSIKVEVWNYPPMAADGYVDRLSLYLTLKDDPDARTEKELDKMLEQIWLKE